MVDPFLDLGFEFGRRRFGIGDPWTCEVMPDQSPICQAKSASA